MDSLLTIEQHRMFRDEGILPDGWIWCPDCNGEGVITTMLATPDLDERTEACHRCEAEGGIVRRGRMPPPEQRTYRQVFIDGVADIFNGTPNASHPVQFIPQRAHYSHLMRCTLCHSTVDSVDTDAHRDWHDRHVKEHDRIMQRAQQHIPAPRYG